MANGRPQNAAELLEGRVIGGRWTVESKLIRGTAQTGGAFSIGYIVRDTDGSRAFLKALDYSRALRSSDPAASLLVLTTAFLFERDLLSRCAASGMSRVVRYLDHGTEQVSGAPIPTVDYIVFELAEGDVREVVEAASQLELAWVLTTLHEQAVGLRQLHSKQIAHQDVKPSNVLMFADVGSKIGDVGRSSVQGIDAPHDTCSFAGDPTYAPPELLYDYVARDWEVRRAACDLYLLGSLIMWFFTDVGATTALLMELDECHHPGRWADGYEAVKPYVRSAFTQVAARFDSSLPTEFRGELSTTFRELCDPDPLHRGHPRNHAGGGSRYSLERYVSQLNRLAMTARIGRLRRSR